MINSFPPVDEEEEDDLEIDVIEQMDQKNTILKKRRQSLDSSIGEAHFHSKPTTLTEESSLATSLGDDLSSAPTTKTALPDYENFPVADKIRKLKKSQSFNAHLEKPPR